MCMYRMPAFVFGVRYCPPALVSGGGETERDKETDRQRTRMSFGKRITDVAVLKDETSTHCRVMGTYSKTEATHTSHCCYIPDNHIHAIVSIDSYTNI